MTPFLQLALALALALIIIVAKLCGYLTIRLGQPTVLGELLMQSEDEEQSRTLMSVVDSQEMVDKKENDRKPAP